MVLVQWPATSVRPLASSSLTRFAGVGLENQSYFNQGIEVHIMAADYSACPGAQQWIYMDAKSPSDANQWAHLYGLAKKY